MGAMRAAIDRGYRKLVDTDARWSREHERCDDRWRYGQARQEGTKTDKNAPLR